MVSIKACAVDGCASTVLARGWCRSHYEKWRRYGDPIGGRAQPGPCKEAGCALISVGQGWCEPHYNVFVRIPRRRQALLDSKAGRRCAHCSEPLPPEKPAKSIFCNRQCKAAARIASGAASQACLSSYYRRNYGLTMERVYEMRSGPCQICGTHEGGGRHGQLHFDHDHATGILRGVLCSECNYGLGKFMDRPDLLRAAADYLEKPRH